MPICSRICLTNLGSLPTGYNVTLTVWNVYNVKIYLQDLPQGTSVSDLVSLPLSASVISPSFGGCMRNANKSSKIPHYAILSKCKSNSESTSRTVSLPHVKQILPNGRLNHKTRGVAMGGRDGRPPIGLSRRMPDTFSPTKDNNT